MINKQNLWYITLFTLIIVLAVYYIAMPDNSSLKEMENSVKEENKVVTTVSESTELVALRISADEEMLKNMESLQTILLDETKTANEKNDAYESLVALNSIKGKEEALEDILLKEFGYNSFIKINDDQISVIIENKEHSKEIANKVMRRIQEEYDTSKYITVKFQ